MPITKTILQATVTNSAPTASAAVDVSGITGDWIIKLVIHSLSAGQDARFVFEESVDSFSTTIPAGAGFSIGNESANGAALPPEGITKSFKKRDFGALTKFGVVNGKFRLNLTELSGGSCTYESWIES